jgi:hypothetical protein
MQVKRRPVVTISIGLDDLPIGNLSIFDKDIGIRDSLAICPAHESFDSEAMICFMRCRAGRRKHDAQAEGDECERDSLSPLLVSPA